MTDKKQRYEEMSGLVGKNLYIKGFRGVKDVVDYNAHLYYVKKVSALYVYLYRYEMDNLETNNDIYDIIYKHFITDMDDYNIIKVLISNIHSRYIVVEGNFKNLYFKQVKTYYDSTVEVLDNYATSEFYEYRNLRNEIYDEDVDI